METKSDDSSHCLQLPPKYQEIEAQLHRAAFPQADALPYLDSLQINTVINLSREYVPTPVTDHWDSKNIRLLNVGLQTWSHPRAMPVSDELVKIALELMLDRNNHPLLVVSSSGTHQVGVLVGCLRRLQHWSIAAILDEYRSFSAPQPRVQYEQFIESWDLDLVRLPPSLPAWFERDQQLLADDLLEWRRLCAQRRGGDDVDPETAEYFRVSGRLCSVGVSAMTTVRNVIDD